jgi:HSP20 family protein
VLVKNGSLSFVSLILAGLTCAEREINTEKQRERERERHTELDLGLIDFFCIRGLIPGIGFQGVARNNIEVTIEDDRTLKISGERVKEDVKEGHTWHVVERVRGAFVRKFRLPENVRLDRIKAEVTNGVLTIVVPKAEKKSQEPRSIEISQGQPQSLEGGASQAGAPAATTTAGGATAAAARA